MASTIRGMVDISKSSVCMIGENRGDEHTT